MLEMTIEIAEDQVDFFKLFVEKVEGISIRDIQQLPDSFILTDAQLELMDEADNIPLDKYKALDHVIDELRSRHV